MPKWLRVINQTKSDTQVLQVWGLVVKKKKEEEEEEEED